MLAHWLPYGATLGCPSAGACGGGRKWGGRGGQSGLTHEACCPTPPHSAQFEQRRLQSDVAALVLQPTECTDRRVICWQRRIAINSLAAGQLRVIFGNLVILDLEMVGCLGQPMHAARARLR